MSTLLAAKKVVDIKSMEDMELVENVRNGDRASYSELVERHRKSMMRLVVKITKDLNLAEDIVQEALIKAYTKIHLFRGAASFKSWLYRITVNTTKNKLRGVKRNMVDIENVSIAISSAAENKMFLNNLEDQVQLIVDELPKKQRLALILRIFEDLSFKEIAVIMGCPYDTAKANYRHALMKLKEKVQKDKNYDGWREIDKQRQLNLMK